MYLSLMDFYIEENGKFHEVGTGRICKLDVPQLQELLVLGKQNFAIQTLAHCLNILSKILPYYLIAFESPQCNKN